MFAELTMRLEKLIKILHDEAYAVILESLIKKEYQRFITALCRKANTDNRYAKWGASNEDKG